MLSPLQFLGIPVLKINFKLFLIQIGNFMFGRRSIFFFFSSLSAAAKHVSYLQFSHISSQLLYLLLRWICNFFHIYAKKPLQRIRAVSIQVKKGIERRPPLEVFPLSKQVPCSEAGESESLIFLPHLRSAIPKHGNRLQT